MWRFVLQVYLWLSVALSMADALVLGLLTTGEDAHLIGAALLCFAGLAAAFALSVPRLTAPKPWHWLLGAVLVAPAILTVVTR
ncbi:hypothetical protein HJG53_15030 [Sphingomonas sp. ID1715]|nr:hypothetical protein [Sphingomonas sp. ID1715]